MVRVHEKSLTGDSRCGQAFAPPTAPPSGKKGGDPDPVEPQKVGKGWWK